MTNDLTMGAGQGADATTAATEPVRRPGSLSSKKLTTALIAMALLACSFAATWQHKPILALAFFAASALAGKVGKL